MKNAVFCAVVASFLSVCSPLEVVVYNETEAIKYYEDSSAYTSGWSYSIPTIETKGVLVYPNPRNACSPLTHLPSLNHYIFAYVEDYGACIGESATNLYNAGYSLMLTSESDTESELYIYDDRLVQAMVSKSFGAYLEENILPYSTVNDTTFYIGISENFLPLYEKLLLVFGGVLCFAILIALVVFCCTFMCRRVWHKWKTRGLTRWRVRQLPRRKYRGSKEVNETCSICLDDFREGETIRVLPCEHVFHPKCVDEWLQKWNRTCPLCKVPISRTGRSRNGEQSRLLQDEVSDSTIDHSDDGRNYGTMDTDMNADTADVDASSSAEEDVAVVVTGPLRDSPRTEEQPV